MNYEKKIALICLMYIYYACSYKDIGLVQKSKIELPDTPYNYLGENANNHIPTLGRVLFYDVGLSKNNSISCASCHIQSFAFCDSAQFSRGIDGKLTERNSMPLQNLVEPTEEQGNTRNFSFFWDGRINSLYEQVLMPITDHNEMGLSIDELINKLNQSKDYKALFQKAFGEKNISKEQVATALSEFLSSIKSNHSKFDLYQNGKAQLTALEEKGMSLFFNTYNCNNCHRVDMLNGYMQGGGFVDIGIETIPRDKGRGNVTGFPEDDGKFKIPTLRNVELTGPYMHDGSHRTLEEVIDHYSHEIMNSANLDTRLKKNNQPVRMAITSEDKNALVAFLKTLTDKEMISDPKFSSPFK